MKLFTASLFAFTLMAAAQEAAQPSLPQPTYTLQVKSNLVVLDVVVTDARGHLVPGLKREDFEVLENKLPQRIRTLDGQSSTAPVAIHSTAELDRKSPHAATSILVLDEVTSGFTDEAFTRYALKQYLKTQGDTLIQPTMLVAVDKSHFNVLRDYTTSRKEILDALDHHFAANPANNSDQSFAADQFNASFVSLMEIAQATAGHPGHKNMIWIGRGFPSIDPTEMLPEDAARLHTLIETCTNMLRDSRVTLYTVDPAGLSADPPVIDQDGFLEADPFGGQIDFNTMARSTGGKAFFGRNDIDHLIGTSIDAGANFYTLSYTPANTAETAARPFRNITVRLKDRSLIATTRAGYYASASQPGTPETQGAADAQTKDRMMFDIAVAGDSTMVYDAVPFTMERSTSIPNEFQIHLNANDIGWQPAPDNKLSASLTVLIESFDKKNTRLKRTAKTLDLQSTPSAPGNEARPRPIEFHIDIPTAAPAVRVRIVLRMNSNGKLGAQNYNLVPEKQ